LDSSQAARKGGGMDAPSQRENFNHPDEKPMGTGIHSLSIPRINPPKFGDGLKFEADVEIGQKGAFCKGLDNLHLSRAF